MRILITLVVFFLFTQALGQEKRERQKKIKPHQMPSGTLELLRQSMPDLKKVRYYEETDGDHLSYEAKFLIQKRFFSVEFSKEGLLEDVEVKISYKNLSSPLRNQIEHYLKQESEIFKVIKAQKQYKHTGADPQTTLVIALHEGESEAIFFELEVDMNKGKGWSSYEILFDRNGRFVSKRRIVTRSLDNLLY